MINVGIIGCGHWGPNHIRIFSQLPNSNSLVCSDSSQDQFSKIKELFPGIETTTDYQDVLRDDRIDAVCIATPTNTHYSISKAALEQGKHVLCEKPLALLPQECEELRNLAIEKKRILMVGHVFVFNAGIVWLKEYIKSGAIGKIYYAYATRTNLGPFRYDVNALWDLAPHDISIFNYLFDSPPLNVSARGQKSLGTNLEDLAFVNFQYPQDVVANIHVSWLDPKKVRQITLVGERKMVVWDDLDNLGPIKLYDKHVERTATFYATYGDFQLLSKEGNITIPNISTREPLKEQGQYFIKCIEQSQTPDLADAQKGLDVVKALCATQKSMEQQGVCVDIK